MRWGSDMHPELIRAHLRMKGYSLDDVAKEAGIGAATVRQALSKPSAAGEKAIAKILNKSLHELWPERWTKDGKRIRPRYAHLYKEPA
ncbi:transcriptional regulator [Neisseria weixii]|uniref:helix-turn-helix domain-containing protein n=1 Tax=Neisseria weixii TaxID=1853276 RepID=UPI00360DAC95